MSKRLKVRIDRDPDKTDEAINKRAVLKGVEHIRDCVEKGKFIRQWFLKDWLNKLSKYHENCETVANKRCKGDDTPPKCSTCQDTKEVWREHAMDDFGPEPCPDCNGEGEVTNG